MRYEHKVVFIKESADNYYDPDAGEWVKGPDVETGAEVNLTDGGDELSKALFGDIKQRAVVIRTQPLFDVPDFDYIRIGSQYYQQVIYRQPAGRKSIILKEVARDA